jgi:hypothetical protein
MAHKGSVDISFVSEDKQCRDAFLDSESNSNFNEDLWYKPRRFEILEYRSRHVIHLVLLYFTNLITAATLLLLIAHTRNTKGTQTSRDDPGIQIYCKFPSFSTIWDGTNSL